MIIKWTGMASTYIIIFKQDRVRKQARLFLSSNTRAAGLIIISMAKAKNSIQMAPFLMANSFTVRSKQMGHIRWQMALNT